MIKMRYFKKFKYVLHCGQIIIIRGNFDEQTLWINFKIQDIYLDLEQYITFHRIQRKHQMHQSATIKTLTKSVVLPSSQPLQSIENLRKQLKQNKQQLGQQIAKINQECQSINKLGQQEQTNMQQYLNECASRQKKVSLLIEEMRHSGIKEEQSYFKTKDTFANKDFEVSILSNGVFYPPSCVGYDIAYCKFNDSIYVYGGISCNSQLSTGLKQHFYVLQNGKWKEVKIQSSYCPMPRYGHTLTGTHDSLLLFGGVSQYKQKLKDRFFYPDVWTFIASKNIWKVLDYAGMIAKPRKNHSACIYGKYYLIHGGLDQSEEVIGSISWVSTDEKKSRWRVKSIQGRYNHQICVHQTQQNRDYLFVYGGRNSESDVVSNFMMYPIQFVDGQLTFKDGFKFSLSLSACEFPIMKNLDMGVVIFGGLDKDNQAVEQCWFFSPQKQSIFAIENDIDWQQMRSSKGVSVNGKYIYLLSGANSKKYKGIKITSLHFEEQAKYKSSNKHLSQY